MQIYVSCLNLQPSAISNVPDSLRGFFCHLPIFSCRDDRRKRVFFLFDASWLKIDMVVLNGVERPNMVVFFGI